MPVAMPKLQSARVRWDLFPAGAGGAGPAAAFSAAGGEDHPPARAGHPRHHGLGPPGWWPHLQPDPHPQRADSVAGKTAELRFRSHLAGWGVSPAHCTAYSGWKRCCAHKRSPRPKLQLTADERRGTPINASVNAPPRYACTRLLAAEIRASGTRMY